jgi:hypothetical protein
VSALVRAKDPIIFSGFWTAKLQLKKLSEENQSEQKG